MSSEKLESPCTHAVTSYVPLRSTEEQDVQIKGWLGIRILILYKQP